MKFGPMKVTDKLGREVILRNAEVEDAKDLMTYLKVTSSETPFLIREPEETEITLEQEENFIKGVLEDDKSLMLIATIDGEHIGNCSLMGMGGFKRYAHRCSIAIALYQKYCGSGIGKIMLETILKVATETGYEQAELEVIANNENAIALYEKIGFKKYGIFPDNVKYKDGSYADAMWMAKKLRGDFHE